MVGWFGDDYRRPKVENPEWFETSIWKKIGFIISGQPAYKYQTRPYIEDLYDVSSLTELVNTINQSSNMFKVKTWCNRGYCDFTKFYALDQAAISTLRIMQ